MKILVTGSDGFIAQNLIETLIKNPSLSLLTHNRGGTKSGLLEKLEEADFLFHLAGVNRSSDESEFVRVNVDLTEVIASYLKSIDHPIPIVFSSSIQSGRETIYGKTKLEAESDGRMDQSLIKEEDRDLATPKSTFKVSTIGDE